MKTHTNLSEQPAYIQTPAFVSEWFLDAIKGIHKVHIATIGETIFPYFTKKKLGFTYVTMPPFALTLGPAFPENTKKKSRHKITGDFLQLLDKYDAVFYNLAPGSIDGQTLENTGYTYLQRQLFIIPAGKTDIVSGYKETLRRNLRKAEKNLKIEPCEEDTLLHLIEKTFARQGSRPPFSTQEYRTLAADKNFRKHLTLTKAVDTSGRAVAAIAILTDKRYAYYFLSGMDPTVKPNLGSTLLIHNAIMQAQSAGLGFHFYGSNLPGVARFMKTFGCEQLTYFAVEKINNPLIKLRKWIR